MYEEELLPQPLGPLCRSSTSTLVAVVVVKKVPTIPIKTKRRKPIPGARRTHSDAVESPLDAGPHQRAERRVGAGHFCAGDGGALKTVREAAAQNSRPRQGEQPDEARHARTLWWQDHPIREPGLLLGDQVRGSLRACRPRRTPRRTRALLFGRALLPSAAWPTGAGRRLSTASAAPDASAPFTRTGTGARGSPTCRTSASGPRPTTASCSSGWSLQSLSGCALFTSPRAVDAPTPHQHRLPLLLKGRERAPWCIAVTQSSLERKRSLPLPLNGGGSFRLYREGDKARVICTTRTSHPPPTHHPTQSVRAAYPTPAEAPFHTPVHTSVRTPPSRGSSRPIHLHHHP